MGTALTTWPHLNLEGTKGVFYGLQTISFILAEIAGRMHTNGESLYLEYSSRDMHFSTKHSDAKDVYAKLDKGKTKYLGVALSDTFLLDFFLEFFDRKKEINVVELMSLFPDFDHLVPHAKAQYLQMLLPEIPEKYGDDARLSLLLSA